MRNLTVLVFGGTGYIGRAVVHRLARAGCRIIVGTRYPQSGAWIRQYGEVGQVTLVPATILNHNSYVPLLSQVDVVVNLTGTFVDSRRQPMHHVHATAVGRLARHAKAANVRQIVHFSAAGVRPDAASMYGRSKYFGENALRELFPTPVVLRPSVVFGAGDQSFCRFAKMAKRMPFLIAPFDKKTLLYPVFVHDLAQAAVHAIAHNLRGSFDLIGPEEMTLYAMMEKTLQWTNRPRPIIRMTKESLMPFAQLAALLPNPTITPDQLLMLEEATSQTPGGDFATFGITPKFPADLVPEFLEPYRVE